MTDGGRDLVVVVIIQYDTVGPCFSYNLLHKSNVFRPVFLCRGQKVVGAGADAVDYKLISMCRAGDIVVSQDYGVAAMALGKGAYAIHQSGKWYTNENIDQMLMERHLNKKARRKSHKNHLKGPRKRTEEDDARFAQAFEKMILKAKEKEGRDQNDGI